MTTLRRFESARQHSERRRQHFEIASLLRPNDGPLLAFAAEFRQPIFTRGENSMSLHKFKVGQSVDFTPLNSGVPPSAREYKIIRLQPAESGGPIYRIKSSSEPFERIAKEIELKRR